MRTTFDLNTPLFYYPNDPSQAFTIKQSVEGICILGSTGAGKTSGGGRFMALTMLSHGYAGLVLTAKHDEAELWKSYCEKTGRLDDLIIIEPGCGHSFNFIEYESGNISSGKSFTQNLVEVLETVIQAGEEKSSGKNDDVFWQESLHMLISHVIDLCVLGYGRVTVQDMYEIVMSVPKKENATTDNDNKEDRTKTAFDKAYIAARDKVTAQITEWKKSWTPEEKVRRKDSHLFEWDLLQALPDARLLRFLDQFFLETYHNLSEKTRSIIDFSFTGFLFRLLREPIFSLFCQHPSTYTPESCLDGKIIVLNLPTEVYHKAGRDIQTLFKFVFQRSLRKRNVEHNPRVLFIWADEAQNFLTPHDADFQATARSSRLATVYLTQNLSNLYASMSGAKAKDKVEALLATMNTKLFHGNSSMETNRWASELIGQAYFADYGRNVTYSEQVSVGNSTNYKLEPIVRPDKFQLLLNGGRENNYIVEAYIHLQGKTFSDGLNHRRISFKQI